MGLFSNFFKWIRGFFKRKGTIEKAAADVKTDSEKEKREEEFVEARIAEVAEDLVKAQNAEKIAKEAEKLEESGQVMGKSLEEVKKEEQGMMLKLDEFENKLDAFRQQLDQILTREEQQDELMEQKIKLAREKGIEYLGKLTADISITEDDKQYMLIIQQVSLISNRVENCIKSHISTIESVRRNLDQSIISTQESIKGIREVKAKGHIIISLFDGVEFRMSALKGQMINSGKELENSREHRDKFLEDWFELMNEELELERKGYTSDKFFEQFQNRIKKWNLKSNILGRITNVMGKKT